MNSQTADARVPVAAPAGIRYRTAISTPSTQRPRAGLLLLFVVSGTAGLLYEVLWARMFGQVFGSSVEAVATTLACFMAGLALGGLVFGRVAGKLAQPLKVYVRMELGVAVLGGALTLTIPHLGIVTEWLASWLGTARAPLALGRVLVVALITLPSTMLMGGTLPVMTRHLTRGSRAPGRWIALLYAANTCGAVVGCLLPDFFLVPALGMRATVLVACALNCVAAGIAWQIHTRHAHHGDRHDPPEEAPAAPNPGTHVGALVALLAISLSGSTAMGYEVLWVRLNTFYTGSQVYNFSLLLAVYLTGLSLGGAFIARWVDRVKNRLALLGQLELWIGVSAFASTPFVIWVYPHAAEWFAPSMSTLEGGDTTDAFHTSMLLSLALTACLVLVPTFLFGATVPVAARILCDARHTPARAIGRVYFWNTIFGIPGALLVGFFLLRWPGSQGTLSLLAALNVALGLLLLTRAHRAQRSRLVQPVVIAVLFALTLSATPRDYLLRETYGAAFGELKDFAEGTHQTMVLVEKEYLGVPAEEQLITGNFSMTARTFVSARYMKLMAHLPALLARDPRSACLICFGLGSTLEGLVSHSELEEIDVVDISPEVFDIYRRMSVEDGALADPRVVTHADDGRNHLLACGRTYDIITLEPPPPRNAGVANLYSREFYQLARRRLSPGGVLCQWIPFGEATPAEMKSMLRSFVEVFPGATLWHGIAHQALLVGTLTSHPIDAATVEERMAPAGVRKDLSAIGFESAEELLATLLLTPSDLAAYTLGVAPVTDDRPLISYSLVSWSGIVVDTDLFKRIPPAAEWLSFPEEWSASRVRTFQTTLLREQRFRAALVDFIIPPPGLGALDLIAERDTNLAGFLAQKPGDPLTLTYARLFPRRTAAAKIALERDPLNADALLHLGRVALYSGDPGAAADLLERARRADPQNAAAELYLLGRSYTALGRLDEARRCYTEVLTVQDGAKFQRRVRSLLTELE